MSTSDLDATNYDFVHPDHKIKTEWPVLSSVAKRLAAALQKSLERQFKVVAEVREANPEISKYGEFLDSLNQSSVLAEFSLPPMTGTAWVNIDRSLLYTLVECYFGGKAQAMEVEADLPLSHTERRTWQSIMKELQSAISGAWEIIVSTEAARMGSIPYDRMPSKSNDHVVVVSEFIIQISEKNFSLQIVYPYSMLEPYQAKLRRVAREKVTQDDVFRDELKQGLMHCEIDVRAVLAEAKMTVAQLLELKKGDFIPLRDIENVSFKTASTPLFDAKVGKSNGHVSARFSRWSLSDYS